MNKIMDQSSVRFAFVLLLTAFLASQVVVSVSARYLPTRSQDDRLDKLRELLKDLLESDLDRRASVIDYGDASYVAPGRPTVYKRSASYPLTQQDKIMGLGVGRYGSGLKERDSHSSEGGFSPQIRDVRNQDILQKSMK